MRLLTNSTVVVGSNSSLNCVSCSSDRSRSTSPRAFSGKMSCITCIMSKTTNLLTTSSYRSIKSKFLTWLELQVPLQSSRKRSQYVDVVTAKCLQEWPVEHVFSLWQKSVREANGITVSVIFSPAVVLRVWNSYSSSAIFYRYHASLYIIGQNRLQFLKNCQCQTQYRERKVDPNFWLLACVRSWRSVTDRMWGWWRESVLLNSLVQ